MDEIRKQKYKNLAFWVMIIVVIATCISLVFYVRSGAMQCMASPLTYGLKGIYDAGGKDISCRCSAIGSNYYLMVTKDNVTYYDIDPYGLNSLP